MLHFLLYYTALRARYLVFYVLLFIIFAFTVLLAFNPAYTQLSKYAMTVAHEANAAKEPICIMEKK